MAIYFDKQDRANCKNSHYTITTVLIVFIINVLYFVSKFNVDINLRIN